MDAGGDGLEQSGEALHGMVQHAGLDRAGGARLRRGRAGHHHQLGRSGIVGIDVGRRFHIGCAGMRNVTARGQRRQRGHRRGRGGHTAARADRGLHLVGAIEEAGNGVLLGLQRVRSGLEAVLGGNQRAVQFVIRYLEVGDAVLVRRLHLLVAVILGGDDAVLEDHIDRGKRHPAQEDQGQAGQGRLQRRTESEELHPPVAADIDLTFGEGGVNPRPGAFQERRLLLRRMRIRCVHGATCGHITRAALADQAAVPEKRA